MNASPLFDPYRTVPEFVPREPNLATMESEDELEDLAHFAAVASLQIAPQEEVTLAGTVPDDDDLDDSWLSKDVASKYLWLILVDDVKVCLEYGDLGRSRRRGRLAHTNLSGNGLAHCGGEMWFKDHAVIYLNGCSGRFRARSADELQAVVKCYCVSGFSVCCFGWNEGTGMPKRTLRKGEIVWQ